MKIPERLNDFRVYDAEDSNALLGMADVTMPTISAMTETISGAGFAGEINSAVLGHFSSMQLTLNWNSVTEKQMKLASPEKHSLDIRGAHEGWDNASGKKVITPVRVYIEGVPTETAIGTYGKAQSTGGSNVLELTYLKVQIDGKDAIEIDKYNYVCKVNGEDKLSDVRKALGLA